MTKNEIIENFDPNGTSEYNTIFGLPFDKDSAELVIIPVPWDVTVSYGAGAALGPQAVLEASGQVDLFQSDIKDAWKMGIYLLPIPEDIQKKSIAYRTKVQDYISWLEEGSPEESAEKNQNIPNEINAYSEELNHWVYEQSRILKSQGKMVALLGGDHSTPLGLIKAVADEYDNFGVLQIDAHADLRESYQKFEFSHASICYNLLKFPQISKLVQVGIRDYCEEEAILSKENNRVVTFYDSDIKEEHYEGKAWKIICDDIIEQLPEVVYVTIDIDGFDPKLCPNTGTPVPGGFEVEQIMYLVKQIIKSGKKIIGFDLVEVAPGEDGSEWDGNVGARVLYRMSNLYGVSEGKLILK